MKTIAYILCWCCIFAPYIFTSPANAIPLPAYSLPELVQGADTVCVGVVTHATSQGKSAMDTGISANGHSYLQDAEAVVADFAVQGLFKGQLLQNQQNIKILFAKNIPARGADILPFTELNVGEHVLVFLNKSRNGVYTLAYPVNEPPAKIAVGETRPFRSDSNISSFRNLLLYLASTLSDSDKAVQLGSLEQVQSIGFLLHRSPSMFSNPSVPARILQSLQEPNSALFEDFVGSKILPSVTSLLSSPDATVRSTAIITAAKLQDIHVVLLLANLAENRSTNTRNIALQTLGDYRVRDAVGPLVALLGSTNGDVKQRSAYALRQIGDPRSLPFLIDNINDSNSVTEEIIISALFFITNESPPPASASSEMSRNEYVAFWKKWAAEHQDKIKALRAQFNASAPVPSAP